MPIKNLKGTDLYGFPELGRIRLGVMATSAKSKKQYPTEADHFVLKDAPSLIPHYGPEPKDLLVYLPYPEIDRNLRDAYELFKRGGLYCQGDGERINWALDPEKSGEVVIRNGVVVQDYREETGDDKSVGEFTRCPGAKADDGYKRCGECRARALLFVLVRDPKNPLRFVDDKWGYYRISTGSIHNIIELRQSLNTVAAIASAIGKNGLAGIPMILHRVAGQVSVNSTNDEGQAVRSKVTKYFLSLEVDPQWATMGAIGMAAQALGKPVGELLSLPEVTPEASEDDVVDGSATPVTEISTREDDQEWAEQIDQELTNRIADIEAMRDTLPGNWGEFHTMLKEVIGTAYDSQSVLLEVKTRLGLARTDKMTLDSTTWSAAVDLMIDQLGGD